MSVSYRFYLLVCTFCLLGFSQPSFSQETLVERGPVTEESTLLEDDEEKKEKKKKHKDDKDKKDDEITIDVHFGTP